LRGIGGIFFGRLSTVDGASWDGCLAYVLDALSMPVAAYGPVVARRSATPFGDRQRRWQLLRRGRYVEFNHPERLGRA
jgi:coproporphyrinogen III oxidase